MKRSVDWRHYVEEIIYGGNDGVVTTFAIISSFVGAGQTTVSSITPTLVLVLGIASLFADGSSMGLGNFLSLRASSDLDKKSSEQSIKHTFVHGMFTFVSFVFFGFIPLLPYIFFIDSIYVFAYSVFFSLLAFSILGLIRNQITGRNLLKSIMENLIIGCVASLIGFVFGYLLKNLV